jgi:hypothetical protein
LDDLLLSSYPDGIAFNPHVAGLADGGFVVAWHAFEANDPVLQRRPVMARVVDADGHMASEIVVAAETNSDPGLVVPAVAVRKSDGAIAVTWADLGVGSDGNGAGVRMRLLRENGMPSGDAFVANTTQVGDQFGASVAAVGDDAFLVAWTDGSMTPPDTEGNGLRARYLYATLDRHDGIIGARCGAADDADCAAELTCAADASGTQLCHPSCANPEGAPCAAGGTCTGGVCAF